MHMPLHDLAAWPGVDQAVRVTAEHAVGGGGSMPSGRIRTGKSLLNEYGDTGRIIPGALGYGRDINYDRLDDLDLAAIEFVASRKKAVDDGQPLSGLDIGCAHGRQSIEFALLGANVYSIDMADTAASIDCGLMKEVRKRNVDVDRVGRIDFFRGDVRKIDFDAIGQRFQFVYSQRTLHYLPYDDTRELFIRISRFLDEGSKIFLGVSGLGSELNHGYGHEKRPIDKRFSRLNIGDPKVKNHDIWQPVCLYTKEELVGLFTGIGFLEEMSMESRFGNVKAIFRW